MRGRLDYFFFFFTFELESMWSELSFVWLRSFFLLFIRRSLPRTDPPETNLIRLCFVSDHIDDISYGLIFGTLVLVGVTCTLNLSYENLTQSASSNEGVRQLWVIKQRKHCRYPAAVWQHSSLQVRLLTALLKMHWSICWHLAERNHLMQKFSSAFYVLVSSCFGIMVCRLPVF